MGLQWFTGKGIDRAMTRRDKSLTTALSGFLAPETSNKSRSGMATIMVSRENWRLL